MLVLFIILCKPNIYDEPYSLMLQSKMSLIILENVTITVVIWWFFLLFRNNHISLPHENPVQKWKLCLVVLEWNRLADDTNYMTSANSWIVILETLNILDAVMVTSCSSDIACLDCSALTMGYVAIKLRCTKKRCTINVVIILCLCLAGWQCSIWRQICRLHGFRCASYHCLWRYILIPCQWEEPQRKGALFSVAIYLHHLCEKAKE